MALGRIRELFEKGEVRPGDRLPAERALAARFKIGRSSVRRALTQLEEEGLVWRHVGQGTFFTGAHSMDLANAIADTASPIEVLEMRLMLEPALAGMAAVRGTSEDIKYLNHCLEHSRTADNWRSFEHWDAQLHRAMALATHNSVAVSFNDVLAAIRARPDWIILKRQSLSDAVLRHYTRQHTAIVKAIAERDASAARRTTQEHLETVRRNLMRDAG